MSAESRAWSEIHPSQRHTKPDGSRWVLVWSDDAGTCLVPWVGPTVQCEWFVLCEWFALCDNPAIADVEHPVLGPVPVCQRCADKCGLVTQSFAKETS